MLFNFVGFIAILLDPRVIEDLLGCGPFARVFVEDSYDEILHGLRDGSAFLVVVVGEAVFSCLYFPEQVTFVLCEERQLANDEDEEDDAASPDISRLAVVCLLLGEVGAHVLRSAALHRQLLVLAAPSCESEVNDLDVVSLLLVDEHVVQLEVAMDNVQLVHVSHGADDLAEDGSSLLFWESLKRLPFLEAVVQVLPMAKLHDEVHVRPRVNDLEEAHDVGMPQVRQYVNLPMKSKGCAFLLQVLLLVNLESNHVIGLAMDAPLHARKGALANL